MVGKKTLVFNLAVTDGHTSLFYVSFRWSSRVKTEGLQTADPSHHWCSCLWESAGQGAQSQACETEPSHSPRLKALVPLPGSERPRSKPARITLNVS